MIVLGYVLKCLGLFKADDSKTVSKIMLNVTLPCALIVNFQAVEADGVLLLVVLIGAAMNLLPVFISKILLRKDTVERRVLFMLNTSGYNIGTFTVPVVATFLSPYAVVTLCMFDIGNAIMCLGGNYAIVCQELEADSSFRIKSFFKKLLSSVPVDAYILMLIFSLLQVRLPEQVLTVAGMIGSANTFLAMFVLGLSFNARLTRQTIRNIAGILGIRYAVCIPMLFIFLFCLPFSLEIRQSLAISMFAPLSIGALAFTAQLDGDLETAGVANSISIVIGLVGMTLLLILFGV